VDQGDILAHLLFILCCWQGGPLAYFAFCHSLFQFQVRLLFDAPKRAYRDIPLRMGHCHPPRFGRMLELDMTSLLGDLNPTICFKSGNDGF
jgi:hypothetical protein